MNKRQKKKQSAKLEKHQRGRFDGITTIEEARNLSHTMNEARNTILLSTESTSIMDAAEEKAERLAAGDLKKTGVILEEMSREIFDMALFAQKSGKEIMKWIEEGYHEQTEMEAHTLR